MKEPNWDRIQEIYHEALKLPCSERSAFVAKATAENPILMRELNELLDVANSLGNFMETPVVELPLDSAADDLLRRTINERYVIERALDHGGMGEIYLARDLRVNSRAVVIKFLSHALLEDAYAQQKFKQEAEALSRIRHPGVVEVLDKGELGNGRPYFVMQYVNGETLDSLIPKEGMRLEYIASILKQIGGALEHVHEQGVFHRDLKPKNIMLRHGTQSVVLLDFGIAKVIDSVVAPTTTTRTSAGTLMYMSPEQLQGKEITVASDVYSMAVVAYEMVTGRRPFNPETSSQLLESQRAGVKVKPMALRQSLSREAEHLILRGLSFKPSARYQNAKEFGDNLADALSASHVTRKNRQWLKILPVILGVALLSVGIYEYCTRQIPTRRSFSYFLTVQKMRDGQPYQAPFRSHGDETFENGDKFQLTITTPIPAYIYIFNEGPPETNGISFTMIYPRKSTNDGSPGLGANQSFESDWFMFKGPAGAENFWIVWSTSRVTELDSVQSEAFKNPNGGLSGKTLATIREYLMAKVAEIDTTTYNYKANQTAVVRGDSDLLVTLEQFKHH